MKGNSGSVWRTVLLAAFMCLAAGEAYLLANDGGSAAFLLCEAGTLSAGKAYLPANGAKAPSLSIVIDDATAIEGLTASKPQNLTTSVYNLAGQKMNSKAKFLGETKNVKVG